jgi:CubicO group peptidase (beta-lactamase class C family)
MSVPALSLHAGVPLAHLSARIQAAVQKALDERRLVGAVVLVARDGVLLHRQAAGWADSESRRAMTTDAIFRLASVSKTIVSTAALVLVAQGRLNLDDALERWLPEFRPRLADGQPARIAVWQLLSHTAGLGYRFFETDTRGPYARAGVSDGMDMSGISLAENLRRIASVPLLYEPGTSWGYSLATDVLGALIERVYGEPLDIAVHQLVTGPLAMADTGFIARDAQRVATAYVNDEPQPHPLAEGEIVSPFDGVVGIRYSPQRIFNPQNFLRAARAWRERPKTLCACWKPCVRGGGDFAQRTDCGNGARSDNEYGAAQCTGLRLWAGIFGSARSDAGRLT